MQKSKIATIAILIVMLLYTIFYYSGITKGNSFIFNYIINPIFWIGIAIFLKFTIGKNLGLKREKRAIIEYCAIAVLIYIITYMISGLFLTFGKNPYSTTFWGIIGNLWMLGTVIVAKEYIRYMLIQNVYEKDKKKIAILISILYIFIDFNIRKFFIGTITINYIIQEIAQNLIPTIATNILYSYTAINTGYIPAIIYSIGTKLYLWISPILPKSPWVMVGIIDTVIPIITLVYIRYMKNKKDIFKSREKLESTDPRSIIPLAIGIILAIWFALGIFPLKPVAVASGSMKEELQIGDVVIIKKCNANDVNVGDIIEYKMDGYTVIHRIIEKNQKNGKIYFITKGDNNKMPDALEVAQEQLTGKVILKIRYLGYPAIWLNNIQKEQIQLQVET